MNDQFYVLKAAREEADGAAKTRAFREKSSSANEWDQAHQLVRSDPTLRFAEPVIAVTNPLAATITAIPTEREEGIEGEYDEHWPSPANKSIWHLDDAFSQLASARSHQPQHVVRIAHFDTGYDPAHITYPRTLIEETLQRNFIDDEGENPYSAIDVGSEGWLNQRGHGSGTLSILAGASVDLDEINYHDHIGIYHNVKIVPIRISRSVILWKNKAFVDALDYVISLYDNPATRCHVITMSMGGLPSKAWADAVNRAYEKGIFIVSAAGNNINRMSPSTLVYPARFNRVTAACGITYDRSPYYKKFGLGHLKLMEGNFGPRKVMGTSIAAFTPNMPWAVWRSGDDIRLNGAGTSSATPQIAAAAALYYQKWFDYFAGKQGWEIVETIRGAMFASAKKEINADFDTDDIGLYFGNGYLQAAAMLEVRPEMVVVKKAEVDHVRFPFLKLLIGANVEEDTEGDSTLLMFEVEISQLIAKSLTLQHLLENEEKAYDELTAKEKQLFWSTIFERADSSETLKEWIASNDIIAKVAQP